MIAASGSAAALADALGTLAAPATRAAAAAAARAHVEAHHDLDATAGRLADLYRELAQAKSAGWVTRARKRSGLRDAQMRRTS